MVQEFAIRSLFLIRPSNGIGVFCAEAPPDSCITINILLFSTHQKSLRQYTPMEKIFSTTSSELTPFLRNLRLKSLRLARNLSSVRIFITESLIQAIGSQCAAFFLAAIFQMSSSSGSLMEETTTSVGLQRSIKPSFYKA